MLANKFNTFVYFGILYLLYIVAPKYIIIVKIPRQCFLNVCERALITTILYERPRVPSVRWRVHAQLHFVCPSRTESCNDSIGRTLFVS